MVEQSGHPQHEPRDNRLFEEIHRLATARTSDSLAPEDETRLDELVRTDPQAREVFVDYVLETTALRAWALAQSDINAADRASEGASSPSVLTTQSQWVTLKRFHPRHHPIRFGVTALSLTIVFWAVILFAIAPRRGGNGGASDGGQPEHVAFITGTHEAVWADAQFEARPGTSLLQGQPMELTRGFAEVTFGSGAVVLLEGPCKFTPQTRAKGHVQRGKLAARVREYARGFTIATPLGEIIDLGTEFGVVVSNSGDVEVVVFEGSVIARPNSVSGEEASVKLTAGQRVEWNSGTLRAAPRGIASQIYRRLPAPIPRETIIEFEPPEVLLVDGANVRNTDVYELGWNVAGEDACEVNGVMFHPQDALPPSEISVETVGEVKVGEGFAAEPELDEQVQALMKSCIGTDPVGKHSLQLKFAGLTPGNKYRIQFLSGQYLDADIRSMSISSKSAKTPVFRVHQRSMTVIAHCQAGRNGEAVFNIKSHHHRAVLNAVTVFSLGKQ